MRWRFLPRLAILALVEANEVDVRLGKKSVELWQPPISCCAWMSEDPWDPVALE